MKIDEIQRNMLHSSWYGEPLYKAERLVKGYFEEFGPNSEDPDVEGEMACFYGMTAGCSGFNNRDNPEASVRYYQAAEYLLRISAERDWWQGYRQLGELYLKDECRGLYYPNFMEDDSSDEALAYADAFDCQAQAFRCFKRAVELEDGYACNELGKMYRDGIACERDVARAYELFVQAWEYDSDETDYIYVSDIALNIASCLENGMGADPIGRLPMNGTAWWRLSFCRSALRVGTLLQTICMTRHERAWIAAVRRSAASISIDDLGREKSPREAADMSDRKEKEAEARSLLDLARKYEAGEGCEKDPKRAYELYDRAWHCMNAFLGDDLCLLAEIALRLGNCLENGIGADPDWNRANAYYMMVLSLLEAEPKDMEEEALAAKLEQASSRCWQEILAGPRALPAKAVQKSPHPE